MTREEYISLYEKHLAGKATPEEENSLLLYRDDFELSDGEYSREKNTYRRVGRRILKRLDEQTGHRQVVYLRKSFWWSAAAAITVFITAALLFKGPVTTDRPRQLALRHDVGPGSNKATLTLASGKVIVLNDSLNGTVINKQGHITIKNQKGGIVEYMAATGVSDKDDIRMNTISTQRGGQYQLVLPDGTKVWLNAVSSLKFPTEFKGKYRSVELTGEAYFEVTKNKNMPFKVKFNHEEIEVLGTHFDIKSYDDEDETKATLLEGSIKISRDNVQRILLPGQQAVTAKGSPGIKVSNADIAEAVAWKNGYFIFHDENIRDIMRTAARWYDVDVVYQGKLDDKQYGGRISKYKNISELLKNLELTGTIHFNIEGRRVTVLE